MPSIHTSSVGPVEIPNDKTLTQFVLNESILNSHGDKVALIEWETGIELTYKSIHTLVHNTAKNLIDDYKAQKGDVIAFVMRNHSLFPVLLHGSLIAGMTVSPINPMCTTTELESMLTDCNARYVIGDTSSKELISGVVSRVKSIEHVFCISTSMTSCEPQPHHGWKNQEDVRSVEDYLLCTPEKQGPIQHIQIDPMNDVAVLPYSSGTTGKQKGVQLTHYNLVANLIQIQSIDSELYDSNLKCICVLPMYHIYGFTVVVNKALEVGGTVVSIPRYNPESFAKIVHVHKPTMLHLVPTIIHDMAKNVKKFKEYDWSSVKCILSGAAPLHAATWMAVSKSYQTIVKQAYGMTEASPILTINPYNMPRHSSVGVLPCNTELMIVPHDPKDDTQGELWFRGPQVMKGYLNNEEATRITLDKDGWLHTGDVGYYNDGHVYITDRIKDLIKYKGYQVSPTELENILITHPYVIDCVVIGVTDEVAGELPVGIVLENLSEEFESKTQEDIKQELLKYVGGMVAPYKKLRDIIFTKHIPRSASGKVSRVTLKNQSH